MGSSKCSHSSCSGEIPFKQNCMPPFVFIRSRSFYHHKLKYLTRRQPKKSNKFLLLALIRDEKTNIYLLNYTWSQTFWTHGSSWNFELKLIRHKITTKFFSWRLIHTCIWMGALMCMRLCTNLHEHFDAGQFLTFELKFKIS